MHLLKDSTFEFCELVLLRLLVVSRSVKRSFERWAALLARVQRVLMGKSFETVRDGTGVLVVLYGNRDSFERVCCVRRINPGASCSLDKFLMPVQEGGWPTHIRTHSVDV